MMIVPTFETIFAVRMTCDSCIQDIETSLYRLNGISKITGNLKDQLVSVEGTAAPSVIVEAIQSTGRDAILRGSGRSNSAAVCILESYATHDENKVRGLVRMVEVTPNMTVVDLSIKGLSPGTYHAAVHASGNISQGAQSAGEIWEVAAAEKESKPCRAVFGTVEVKKDGVGSMFLDRPIQIWEIIGRSIVVAREQEGKFDKNDSDTLVGVIARSAGVWDNDKTICSCSGKTVWQERKEQRDRGML